jgi:hypothetical protein
MRKLFTAALVAALFVSVASGLGTVTNDYSETRTIQVAGWYFTTTTNGAAEGTSKAISGQALRAWVVTPADATNPCQISLSDAYGSTLPIGTFAASSNSAIAFTHALDGPITLTVTSTLQGPVWSGKFLLWYR